MKKKAGFSPFYPGKNPSFAGPEKVHKQNEAEWNQGLPKGYGSITLG